MRFAWKVVGHEVYLFGSFDRRLKALGASFGLLPYRKWDI